MAVPDFPQESTKRSPGFTWRASHAVRLTSQRTDNEVGSRTHKHQTFKQEQTFQERHHHQKLFTKSRSETHCDTVLQSSTANDTTVFQGPSNIGSVRDKQGTKQLRSSSVTHTSATLQAFSEPVELSVSRIIISGTFISLDLLWIGSLSCWRKRSLYSSNNSSSKLLATASKSVDRFFKGLWFEKIFVGFANPQPAASVESSQHASSCADETLFVPLFSSSKAKYVQQYPFSLGRSTIHTLIESFRKHLYLLAFTGKLDSN